MPACQECGLPFTPGLTAPKSGLIFCSAPCRKRFNNRRMTRGADIYDLLMSERYDRATQLEAQKMMRRRAAEFRQEDRELRQGRPSWRPLRVVIERKPSVLTTPMGKV